jgi:hypothetical protein
MKANTLNVTLAGLAIGIAIAFPAVAAPETPTNDANPAPTLAAQSAPPSSDAREPVVADDAFPAHQRGVRRAAAEGPDALRRYVWRTRMIYNFSYKDFAPKE